MENRKTPDSTPADSKIHCSFCAKSQGDVETLVAGPGVFICNECTGTANSIIASYRTLSDTEAKAQRSKALEQRIAYLEAKQPEELLEFLVNIERTRRSIDAHQQVLVDLLREKRVRWAEVGNALGVTRQAAWQRFAAAK